MGQNEPHTSNKKKQEKTFKKLGKLKGKKGGNRYPKFLILNPLEVVWRVKKRYHIWEHVLMNELWSLTEEFDN